MTIAQARCQLDATGWSTELPSPLPPGSGSATHRLSWQAMVLTVAKGARPVERKIARTHQPAPEARFKSA